MDYLKFVLQPPERQRKEDKNLTTVDYITIRNMSNVLNTIINSNQFIFDIFLLTSIVHIISRNSFTFLGSAFEQASKLQTENIGDSLSFVKSSKGGSLTVTFGNNSIINNSQL